MLRKVPIRVPPALKHPRVWTPPRSGRQQAGVGDISRVLRVFADVVAPTTIITALLVYVGWIKNQAYYGYFGINQGVLRLSVQDYALRSIDVTFGAVTRLVTIALMFVALDRILSYFTKRYRTKIVGWMIASLALSGVVFLSVGLLLVLGITPGFTAPFTAAAILGVGAVLIIRFGSVVLASRGSRRSFGGVAEVALYMTLTLALFWAATLHAQDVGQRTARGIDEHPSTLSLVTIFSENFLDLPGSRVRATQIESQGKHFFRYTGLYLLTYSNSRWFLITGRYNNDYRSSVVILQDSGSIRVEIAAAP
jgi:hypothetical protein